LITVLYIGVSPGSQSNTFSLMSQPRFFMAKVNAEQRILLQSQTNEGKIKRPKPGGIPNSGLRSRLTKYV